MKKLLELIGKTALLKYSDGLSHRVKIEDVKQAYGRVRVLVAAAAGMVWVDIDRLKMEEEEK